MYELQNMHDVEETIRAGRNLVDLLAGDGRTTSKRQTENR